MSRSNFPLLPCMCSSFRRAARNLTHIYEEVLRPLGLRATQFTVLQVLSQAGPVSQGRLGEMLAMDSTSLTRTVAIMVREGWIAERRGKDRRERWLYLSDAGEVQLNRALPVWEAVQTRVRDRLGNQAWAALEELTYQVASVAPNYITEEGEAL